MPQILNDDIGWPTEVVKGVIVKMKSDLQQFEGLHSLSDSFSHSLSHSVSHSLTHSLPHSQTAIYVKQRQIEINKKYDERYDELKHEHGVQLAEIESIKESLGGLQKMLNEKEYSLKCTHSLTHLLTHLLTHSLTQSFTH